MKKTVLEKREVERLDDILCDMCGVSCRTDCGYESAQLYASWGYCSKSDGAEYNIDLCENCFHKVIDIIEATRAQAN